MACSTIVTTNNNNSIGGLLRRIDQMQKEALLANANALCDSCLMSSMYNTKPISLYVRGQLFQAFLGLTPTETMYFRVEEVRGEIVILRLLTLNNGVLECTSNTVTVNIGCICSIQCYDPINCNLINCPCGIIV